MTPKPQASTLENCRYEHLIVTTALSNTTDPLGEAIKRIGGSYELVNIIHKDTYSSVLVIRQHPRPPIA